MMSQPLPTYAAESQRLYLQPLSLGEHLEDFHELWRDEEIVKWTLVFSLPHTKTPSQPKSRQHTVLCTVQ